MSGSAAYLAVLGEQEAIRWVVSTGRMAFPSTPRREVGALREGDVLFLLSTRGAFHNPTRDRTRVIGRARVTSSVLRFDTRLELAGRIFESGCSLRIMSLAPYREGVEIAPLAGDLDVLVGKTHWGMLLRRPLVRLNEADAALLGSKLAVWGSSIDDAIATYRERTVRRAGTTALRERSE